MQLKAKVEGGVVRLTRTQLDEIARLKGDVLITIEKLPFKRSEKLSRYYYGVVVDMWLKLFKELAPDSEKMLHNKESTHYWLTKNYSPVTRVDPLTSEEVQVGMLNRKMTNDQLQEHITRCVQGYLAETGDIIPPPIK